jgi:hypothetical protein
MIRIKPFLKIIALSYYFILLLLHYLEIGRILPLPQTGADISTHVKNTEHLITDPKSYNAYPYIGFHLFLAPLYLLFDYNTLYYVAGLLVFLNLAMIIAFYVLIERLFSSSTPAFFATLSISAGNLTWVKLLQCVYITAYRERYKCFNPFECLLFNSKYNISNYLLIQFSPLTLSLILTCLFLILLVDKGEKILDNALNKALITLLTIFIYLVHPLYATLLPLFLSFAVFITYWSKKENLLSKHFSNLFSILCVSGFAPTLIAYIVSNVSEVYRFQTFIFSLSNIFLCLIIFYLLKNKHLIIKCINKLVERNCIIFFKGLLLIIISIWAYGLYSLYFIQNFNAWKIILQPTPLLLYPIIIGWGPPLIVGLLTFVKEKNLKGVLLILLIYPFLFVIIAPLIDYVNFYILGFYVDNIFVYSGVTSGRMLALANLLYLITSGTALGCIVDLSPNYKYITISVSVLFILTMPNIITSLKYWNIIYQLLLPRLSSSP